ncbi:hypothetical protein [Xanthobacter tagetidis]|jgi:hypothetical protein|uniref:Uncharacterized protein n=1 Tax=Xanthobacter tagetidis TaxID=60216 RepID=A0A3L7AR73_9HYPH|nr:hypothetical protein [Xanthobacter tagetidis]MBB6308315.1 hypothetical protein [Xanthobacter tagetidis]RLP81918.1 hypothetical protein D9R14_02730 [Xanthobacter tagetidis]
MPTETAAAPRRCPAVTRGWRVRAFRAEESDDMVKRRMEALRLGSPHAAEIGRGEIARGGIVRADVARTETARAEIARALRLARKAVRSRHGAPGDYDPARHAALLRLARGARDGGDGRIR